ncbi:MAG: peroxiredoxin-like family protein [Verrucomicrobiales bacterium]|nr:peroxiredoxin-like family protein [Verrucomicrobiales bacterium]
MEPDSDPLSLNEQIQLWNAEHASEFPDEVQQIFAAKTREIIESGLASQCLTQGDDAPDFSITNGKGETVQLGEKLQNGPAILSFYRGTWCPYCNLEFQALLDRLPQFRERDAVILALSPQVQDRQESPATQGFEDLSDQGNAVARRYGLVYPLGEEIAKIYRSFGLHLEKLNGDDSLELPLPATYIIDRDARIRYAFTSGDISERAEPEELVEVLAGI